MAIQNIGTTISGIASDTKPTLTANEKGVIFIETDTNKIYQWDTDSWNQVVATVDDNAITLAKMASGTDGQIITYDASGNPTAVGPGTDGQILTSTGAGSPPAFEDAAGGGGGTIDLVADGAIAAGAAVHLTSAGKAKQIKGAWDYPRSATMAANRYISFGISQVLRFHWDDANNKLVTGMHSSNYLYSPVAIEVVDTTNHYTGVINAHGAPADATYGYTARTLGYYNASCYDEDTDRLIIGSTLGDGTYDLGVFVSGLSGTTWTMGTVGKLDGSNNHSHLAMAYDKTANKVVAVTRSDADGADGYCTIGTVTGGGTNSISWGTPVEFLSGNTAKCGIVYVTSIGKCVAVFDDSDDNANFKSVNISVSGTTPSFGSVQTIKSNLCEGVGADSNGICYDENADRIVAFFSYNSASSGSGGGGHNFSDYGHKKYTAAVAIGAPVSTHVNWVTHDFYTPGSDTMGHSAAGARHSPMYFGLDPSYNGSNQAMGWDYISGWISCCYVPDAQKILVVFVVEDAHMPTVESHGHNTSGTTMYMTLGTISNTQISFTSPEVIFSGIMDGGFTVGYDQQNDRAMIGFGPAQQDQLSVIPGAWESGSVEDFNVGYLDQYLGLATAGVSDGETVTVTIPGGVNENQSSLVVGSTYYLAPTGEIHNQLARHWKGHQITIGQAISATKILVGSEGYGKNLQGAGKY